MVSRSHQQHRLPTSPARTKTPTATASSSRSFPSSSSPMASSYVTFSGLYLPERQLRHPLSPPATSPSSSNPAHPQPSPSRTPTTSPLTPAPSARLPAQAFDLIACVTDPLGSTDTTEAPVPECVNPIDAPDLTGNHIVNSFFYDTGILGVRIGGPYVATFNDNNSPRETLVENNVVEGYGRTIPAAFGLAQGFGHNNLYTHNDVYDGYHCAISVTTNAGADKPNGLGDAYNIISFNHVHDLLQGIMNDGGSIRVENGNVAYVAPGDKIFNNKIHDVTDASIMDANGYGGHGIYLGQSDRPRRHREQLRYRVSDSTVYTPHGPSVKKDLGYPNEPNLVKNNILAFGRLGVIEEGNPYQYSRPRRARLRRHQQSLLLRPQPQLHRRAAGSYRARPFNIPPGLHLHLRLLPLPELRPQHLLAHRRQVRLRTPTPSTCRPPSRPRAPTYPAPAAASATPRSTPSTTSTAGATRSRKTSTASSATRTSPTPPTRSTISHFGRGLEIGFVPFNPDQAGRYPYSRHLVPPAIPATFTTMTFNPATDY